MKTPLRVVSVVFSLIFVLSAAIVISNIVSAQSGTWTTPLALVEAFTPAPITATTPTWSQLTPTGGPPSSRAFHTSVYDTANNRMTVLAGGTGNWCSVPTLLNDVWVLTNADGSGGTPNWNQLSPTGPSPAPRGTHDSVYDPATNRMIVFGGDLNIGNCSSAVNDVWVLTNANGLGGTPAWIQLTPSGGPPQLRQEVKAVYNSATNRLIVFSGNNNGCVPFNSGEVWVLSNANGTGGAPVWTQLAPTGVAPAPRTSDSLVYDAANNRLTIFAGGTASGYQNDVWVLANADGFGGTPNWTQLAPSGPLPGVRVQHTAVYNAAINQMVIFGGVGQTGIRFNDVWVLSNANGLGGTPAWAQVATTGGPPSSRRGHSAVYNPTSNRMTVYAGLDSDCTATGDLWTLADVTSAVPSPSPTPTPPVPSATSVVDTGSYNINEMSLDPTNGDIYLNGYNSGSSELSIVKVAGGSLTALYSPLPGTTGGNLTYTNGFAVHTANLWWNNANAGPGFATELSSAPKVGGGPITRTSPTDDLDSLSSDGSTLFTAYYAGYLYTVTSGGGISFIGFHRGTSHLAIAADAGILYVVDDSGAYRRNLDGSFTDINSAANRYRTNGSRLGEGGGFVYALDRSVPNGFWQINEQTGVAIFITDPNFTNLNAIGYYNGFLYAADTGELPGQPNVEGHVWQIDLATPTPTPTPTPLPVPCTTVTNTNDSGSGSLRQAILCANSNPGPDTVSFNIPTTDPGFNGSVFTIRPLSALPTLTDNGTTIDGATQTVFTGNTNAAGPEIVINGGLMGFSGPFGGGFNIPSSGNHIHSLVINGFNNTGISITGAGATGNLVTGCFLGTNASGTGAVPNSSGMVITQGASNNVVGGTSAPARNLISGNAGNGIIIQQFGTNNNIVQGNFIGTDVTGTIALTNAFSGILIGGTANGNLVGGTSPGARNLISGNGGNGLSVIDPDSTANQVQGNFIGTDVTGNAALANAGAGINLRGAPNNIIGGTSSGAGNLISGNGGSGIVINTSSATGNQVQGNFIGTDVSGSFARGNGRSGIEVDSSNNTIGGTTTAARNVISGNQRNGIGISGNTATGNSVQGNLVGTNSSGTDAVANGLDGISIISGASNNIIGGTIPTARNLISGNVRSGIIIGVASNNNLVQGNYIGTNAAGTHAIGNASAGVILNGALNNTIGGTASGAGNLISGNGGPGSIGNGVAFQTGAVSNQVQGNYIGTDVTGNLALENSGNGILLAASTNNLVGGPTAAARNIISGNGLTTLFAGVAITRGASGNQVQGNYIGTNAAGNAPLGNGGNGVLVGQTANSASNNTIGGASGEGNVIAFNGSNGILVFNNGSLNNAVRQNSIFSNAALGIDLGLGDGVTANDSCDGDTGANNLQNFPVLTSVNSSGGSTTIQGTLNSIPNTTFTIEFFSNDACDPSGFGEGQTFIGSTTVTTDGNCNASFMFTSTSALSGQFITATATDPNGNTSEFSACGFVNADVSIIKTASPNPVVTGSDITYTLAVNYTGPAPAVNVTVADDLPPQTTFKSNSAPAAWICTTPAVGANGTVTCTKPSMAPGETAMFTIVATVDCSVTDGIVISDTATVSSSTTDSNATNNSSAANVTASNPPPTITCPANVTITTSLGSNSAAVSYPAPNASDNCGVPIVSCELPSGSSFPIGTTTVNCTATDSSNNTSSCTFSVTVLTPQGATQQLSNTVNSLVSQGTLTQGSGDALTSKLQAAIASMNSGNTTAGCNQLQAFINQTQAFINAGKLTPEQGQALIDSANAVKAVLGC